MHQIPIDDQLYADVSRRAADAGFPSVEAYVIDILKEDVADSLSDLDGFFTPERLAEIDRAAAQAEAGQVISTAEARERFRRMTNDGR